MGNDIDEQELPLGKNNALIKREIKFRYLEKRPASTYFDIKVHNEGMPVKEHLSFDICFSHIPVISENAVVLQHRTMLCFSMTCCRRKKGYCFLEAYHLL